MRLRHVPGRFEGTVALVTGSATGIGRATVERIVAEGGRVFAGVNRTRPDFETVPVDILDLDVTDAFAWGAALKRISDVAGRLDVLVNNAGVRESGLIEETSVEQWRTMIDLNLTSTFLGCRAALPLLRASGGGAIVNVGSITGIRGTENMVAYSASKGGITSMTASLALDTAQHGIRVNAVCPAAIETRMVSDWIEVSDDADGLATKLAAKHPIGRLGSAEEVAATIAFLASYDAGFLTGLSIPVDGGRSIR